MKHISSTVRFFILIGLIAIMVVLGKVFHLDLPTLKAMFSEIPLLVSGIIFIALYVGLTTLIWVGPKDILRIFGAIFFGAYISTFLIWIGETCNAAVLFSISRKLGRDFVQERFKLKDKHVDATKQNSGFWGIFILKNVLFIPLRVLDLGFGLTRISLKKYLIVSALATPLRIFVIQFVLEPVGETILTDPMSTLPVITQYLMDNAFVLKWAGAYIIIAIILMFVFLNVNKRRDNS